MSLLLLANVENLAGRPVEFWIKALLIIVGLFVLFWILEKLFKTSRLILSIALLVVIVMIGYNWIYHRNEPAFMTPALDILAPVFGGPDRPATPPAGTTKRHATPSTGATARPGAPPVAVPPKAAPPPSAPPPKTPPPATPPPKAVPPKAPPPKAPPPATAPPTRPR
ncbi:MAG: hypothetical protein LBI02_09290 [Opitutaceae bacterium]|jgi:hypothetical protein|nr:hypothetical protein [Opitutaceae bacterium]